MISKEEIKRSAREFGLRPDVVEKDYVLGWTLLGIANHPHLSKNWVFKGGTCIKKCFLNDYRFSEDLDFTIKDRRGLQEKFLTKSFSEVMAWVTRESGVELYPDTLNFEKHHERDGYASIQGSFAYQGPMMMQKKTKPKIHLDLTSDEVLVYPAKRSSILHGYSDKSKFLHAKILSYSFEELFAEKLRALLQRARPRDVYDVVNLFDVQHQLNSRSFKHTLERKFTFRSLPMPTWNTLNTHKATQDLPKSWDHMLGHQIANLENWQSYWSRLEEVLNWTQSL